MITTNFEAKITNFPNGEIKYNLGDIDYKYVSTITWEYESDSEFFQLALLADTLKGIGEEFHLIIPYLPYSRQDRPSVDGESFSLKTACNLINNLGAHKVKIYDPHSDVTRALINNIEVSEQHEIVLGVMDNFIGHKPLYLISPDSGALKKTYKLAAKIGAVLSGVVECSKHRNTSTGEITNTIVHYDDFKGKDCLIVDDLCEAGKTFIEVAKVLKKKNAGKITLFVTHGFFSKGVEVFDNLIDEIYTHKGRVK